MSLLTILFFFESYTYSDAKIQMFGAVKYEMKNIDAAVRLVSKYKHSLFVLIKKNNTDVVKDIVEMKWDYNFNLTLYDNIPEKLFYSCSKEVLIIYKMFGEFDDIDIDCALIGTGKMLNNIN